MADELFLENRARVRAASWSHRLRLAVVELLPVTMLVVIGANATGLTRLLTEGRTPDVMMWKAGLAAAALAVGYVVVAASASSFEHNAFRRNVGVRIVDARTYSGIGPVRSVLRVLVRDAEFLAALAITARWIEPLPSDAGQAALVVVGWVIACRIAPLVIGALLPRNRAPHDWLLRTVVIDAGDGAPRPHTVGRLIGEPVRVG